jgi:hypothetical protein
MAFARGKYAKAISDRSGMEFPYNEMIKEWNGMLVHKSEYEAKHPQLETRGTGAEGHGLEHVRPAREENEVSRMLDPNPFETIAAASGILNVFEKSHGRDTDDTVRFRGPIWTSSDSDAYQDPKDFDGISGSNIAYSSGYSITVGKRDSSGDITNTNDYYHFTVNTNTATSGGVSGGGNSCSAGPATITA